VQFFEMLPGALVLLTRGERRLTKRRCLMGAKKKSSVVSWLGVLMSIIQLLAKKVQELGGNDDDIHYLSTPEGEDLVVEFAKKLMERRMTWLRALKKAYELCDLGDEFRAELPNFNLKEEEGFWKILMVKGLTYKKVVQAYQKAGVALETYGVNLQEIIDFEKEQRNPNNDSYVVGFAANMEADEVNKNQSAEQRAAKNCQDGTLLERLLLGLVVFLANKGHLDQKTTTQCSGSRILDSYVPFVAFFAGKEHVDWHYPGIRDDKWRARSAEFLS